MTALRRILAAVLGFLAAAGLVQWYALLTHEPFGADGFVSDVECDPGDTPKHGKDLA